MITMSVYIVIQTVKIVKNKAVKDANKIITYSKIHALLNAHKIIFQITESVFIVLQNVKLVQKLLVCLVKTPLNY